MKRINFIIIILALILFGSCQTEDVDKEEILSGNGKERDAEFDNGSNISFPEMNENLMTNLELLGKLWGFLKYHHPAIGKGEYNWDYELFRILPEYLNASDNNQRDKILLDRIEKLGVVPACTTCKETPSDAVLKPDFSWVESGNMNKALKDKINEIYTNRHQGEHFYIDMYPNIGNPDFKNESLYSKMPYPDAGFRLLSLYKYWNMIQYFYPNKHLTDKNWNDVLKEYISIFISAKSELEYEFAAIQLFGEVCDSHIYLLEGGEKIQDFRGYMFAPFKVQFVEKQLVVTEYYNPEYKETSELEIGDVITHINGIAVESIVDSLKKYYPASNETARLRDISFDLLRLPYRTISVTYISSNQTKQKELTLYHGSGLNIYSYKVNNYEKCYKLLSGNIGYITLATIKGEDISEIKELFKDTKGIIIDIRNYPSTFVPLSLGSYFVSSPTSFAKFSIININNPGEFTLVPGQIIPSSGDSYQRKLVVMVNENSQSLSEYTAMALKAGQNTTIIGSTTAGADGNVSHIQLPGGIKTSISGIGVYYPDGTETQRVGIIPDVIVEPTIEGIKARKDEVLEKAIEIINEQE